MKKELSPMHEMTKKDWLKLQTEALFFSMKLAICPSNCSPNCSGSIEESTFRRVGGLKDIRVKIRIIAATNVDIEEQIDRGTFREDLYYRLNVIPIPLPPLRDRGEDILLLADFFLHDLQRELKKNFHGFTPEACSKMLHHDWQGNIRELRNYIEREVIFTKSGWITLATLPQTN